MLRFEIPHGSPWHQLRVMDAAEKYGNHFLICIRERDGEILIPGGADGGGPYFDDCSDGGYEPVI